MIIFLGKIPREAGWIFRLLGKGRLLRPLRGSRPTSAVGDDARTGDEDNGLHLGLLWRWPATGGSSEPQPSSEPSHSSTRRSLSAPLPLPPSSFLPLVCSLSPSRWHLELPWRSLPQLRGSRPMPGMGQPQSYRPAPPAPRQFVAPAPASSGGAAMRVRARAAPGTR